MIPDLSVLFLFKASVFEPADNVLHVGGCFLSSIKTAFLHILEIIKEGFEKSIFLNRKEHNFTVEFLKDQSSDISTDTKMQIGRNVVQGVLQNAVRTITAAGLNSPQHLDSLFWCKLVIKNFRDLSGSS